jgi:hypothetical protein
VLFILYLHSLHQFLQAQRLFYLLVPISLRWIPSRTTGISLISLQGYQIQACSVTPKPRKAPQCRLTSKISNSCPPSTRLVSTFPFLHHSSPCNRFYLLPYSQPSILALRYHLLLSRARAIFNNPTVLVAQVCPRQTILSQVPCPIATTISDNETKITSIRAKQHQDSLR